MKQEIWRHYPVGNKVDLVERLLERGVLDDEARKTTRNRQPGRSCVTGCRVPEAPPERSRPYVDSAITFLKAFTHTNRSGPEGEKAWADLRAVSADKVPMKIGGKELVLDAGAGHSNVQLVRFSKVSTWREA